MTLVVDVGSPPSRIDSCGSIGKSLLKPDKPDLVVNKP